MENEIVVISVGGSLIAPNEIDVNFLREFRRILMSFIKKGKRFVLICGGGSTARTYQKAASSIVNLGKDDIDWLGIHATRINAHLMKSLFIDVAHPKIIKNPLKKMFFKEKVLIAAGWKPGRSTDYCAVLLAREYKIKSLINLSNIDYVCDKDPKKFKDAKSIERISWKGLRKMLPKKWDPGLNSPFDPVAAREGEKICLKVAIMNGKNLENFKNYLNGKSFVGTFVS